MAAEDKLICRCYLVPESAIRRAVAEHGLHHVEEVTAVTRAGGGCSSCWDEIQALLAGIHGQPLPRDVPDASGLSAAQKRALIVKTLEVDLRRLLDLNGLQVQLVEVGGDRVLARFYGDQVGTTTASFLAIKWCVVERMSDACGMKMNLVELNVLEGLAKSAKA
jgi:bacterioferritin-associated ferredoxin